MPETVQHWTRLILPILACVFVSACSIAPTGYTDMLHTDDKYSPFANYFVIDDSAQRKEIVVQSLSLIGTDYKWGGNTPQQGFDCSGMVIYVVQRASRRSLPHHAATIARMTRPIKRNELAPGDLVFFNTMKRRHSHVGVYLGDSRFVHAPAPGHKVRIDSLKTRYYGERLDGVRSFAPKP